MPELARSRWPEIDDGPRRLLVVPLGSLEQHGPHLPLDTDTRIAAAVAARACAGVPGVGLAPPVAIGASGEHAGFPGTLSIGTAALSALLVELGRHASLHWPAMLLVNGHGGNVPAIKSALDTLRSEGREARVWHAGLPEVSPGVPADAHAGRFETSVMLALAPDDVRMTAAAPGNTRPLAEIMPDLTARGVRAVSGDGVLGDPAGASAAEGARLVERMADGLRKTLEAFLSRTPHGTCPLSQRNDPAQTVPGKRWCRRVRLDNLGAGLAALSPRDTTTRAASCLRDVIRGSRRGGESKGQRRGAGHVAAASGRVRGVAATAARRSGNDPGRAGRRLGREHPDGQ